MNVQAQLSLYSQLSPCGHPAMTDIQYGQQLILDRQYKLIPLFRGLANEDTYSRSQQYPL